jgi:sigma-B regulation protein RsbU (phosphoserine phosphatase)
MKNLFSPAASLMARLKYPQRFGLITVLFLLPLGIALFMLVSKINHDIDFAQRETDGITYLRPTYALFKHTLNDWLLSQQAYRGLDTNDDALRQNQTNMDQDFQDLAAVDGRYGAAFGTTAAFTKLKSDWAAMRALPQNSDRQVLYEPFIASIRDLISQVGDKSNLILDSGLDTHYTMQTLVVDLPSTQDEVTHLAVLGNQVLNRRNLEDQDKADLQVLGSQILEANITLRHNADTAYANDSSGGLQGAVDKSLTGSIDSNDAFVSMLTDQILTVPQLLLPLDTWMSAANKALDAGSQQWGDQAGELDSLLQARGIADANSRNIALLIAATVLLLVAYIWVGFYMAIMRSVNGLEEASALLASGTLSSVDLGNKDELSQRTAQAISQMASTTSTLNSRINARTNELTEVALLLAHMNDGVVITDERGVVKVLNGAASRMMGTRYEDAVTHPLVDLTQQPRLRDTIAAAVAAPSQQYMVDIALGNRIVLATVTFVTMADGHLSGLFVLQDVTELRTLQALQAQQGNRFAAAPAG